MAKTITFTMIKPGAVNHEHIGPIMTMINDAGFSIKAMKMIQLKRKDAEEFYCEHKGKKFYEELVEFMSSGPIIAMILEKENAVADYRKLMGHTDPTKADEGTIRRIYAEDMGKNAVHGSDCDEAAIRESSFFFSKLEMF